MIRQVVELFIGTREERLARAYHRGQSCVVKSMMGLDEEKRRYEADILYELASGIIDTSDYGREFDRGVRATLREYGYDDRNQAC